MKKRSTGHSILHISLIAIVIGAIFTAFASEQGNMVLFADSNSNFFADSNTGEMYYMDMIVVADSICPDKYFADISVADGSATWHKRIALNSIARIKGYRFSLNTFDTDGKSVILNVNHDPIGTNIVFAGFGLFIAGVLILLIDRKSRIRVRIKNFHPPFNAKKMLNYIALGVVLLFAILLPDFKEKSQIPILNTVWLRIHVTFVMLSYSIFTICFVSSIIWLARKNKPEYLEQLERILHHAGVYLLAFGIITGSWWANISWGNYWNWDPKETWALVTLIAYSVPFHFEKCFANKKIYAIFMVCALAFVLMTYFGVNLWMPGLHSYA